MIKFVIFTSFLFYSSILSIQSVERSEFRNVGSHFERNTFEKDAKFDDFVVEDLLNRNLTREDYKILTKLGLKQYFKLVNAINETKKIVVGKYVIKDGLNFTTAANGSNVFFEGVRGLSSMKVENPHVNSILDSKFEVRAVIRLPELVFYGHFVDTNKPFQLKLDDVSYVVTEYNKVNDEFHVETIQNSEEIHFNRNELTVGDEKNSNRTLDRECLQQLSAYLFDVSSLVRMNSINYWAGADNWYLRQRKEQMLDKLFKIVLRTAKTYTDLACEVPRFTFRDEKTSTNYEMINGFLEIDAASVRSVSKNINENGDVEMAFPLSGSLKYYVSQLNCTSSCHFFGHRFQVSKTDVRVAFSDAQIKDVQWSFEMKYGEALVDNRPKSHTDDSFNVILENVSKVVNEKFLVFLKSFLGPEFF